MNCQLVVFLLMNLISDEKQGWMQALCWYLKLWEGGITVSISWQRNTKLGNSFTVQGHEGTTLWHFQLILYTKRVNPRYNTSVVSSLLYGVLAATQPSCSSLLLCLEHILCRKQICVTTSDLGPFHSKAMLCGNSPLNIYLAMSSCARVHLHFCLWTLVFHNQDWD